MIETKIDAKNATQNPSMTNVSPMIHEVSINISALIIKINIPNVMNVIGNVRRIKIGLNSEFNIVKIRLANNAVPNPLILNELNNCDTAMSAIAYNTSCKKNCNICRIQISPHIVLPITFMLSPKHLFIFPDKKTFST